MLSLWTAANDCLACLVGSDLFIISFKSCLKNTRSFFYSPYKQDSLSTSQQSLLVMCSVVLCQCASSVDNISII